MLVIVTKTQASGRRLRAVREVQGRSLRGTAREAGVDPAYLSRVERGLQRPSVGVLLRVGRVLGLRDLVDTITLFWEDDSQ